MSSKYSRLSYLHIVLLLLIQNTHANGQTYSCNPTCTASTAGVYYQDTLNCIGSTYCTVQCKAWQACYDTTINCKNDIPCNVHCGTYGYDDTQNEYKEEGCIYADINGNGATSLTITTETEYENGYPGQNLYYSTIVCPTGGSCSVTCTGTRHNCRSLYIDASLANSLNVYCTGSESTATCGYMTIHCPDAIGSVCSLEYSGTSNSYWEFYELDIYSLHGFNQVSITGTSSVANTYATLYCQVSECSISGTSNSCNSPTICNNPPTSTPTGSPTTGHPTNNPTYNPTLTPSVSPSLAPTLSPSLAPTLFPTLTPSVAPSVSPTISPTLTPSLIPSIAPTLIPTTSNPTTANPTTYNPTTANPTTYNPTTSNPTTYNPTTSNPTTYNPTTANPTTTNPTTYNPTTSKPTTANPTTSNPTTVNPTTSNPTTSNPTTSNPTTSNPTTLNPTTLTKSPTPSPTTFPTPSPTINPTPSPTSNPTTSIPTTFNPTTSNPTTIHPASFNPGSSTANPSEQRTSDVTSDSSDMMSLAYQARKAEFAPQLENLSNVYRTILCTFAVICMLVGCSAFIDAKKFRVNDYFKIGCIIKFALQTTDMFSDCFFAVQISIENKIELSSAYTIIFTFSIIFIIVPAMITLFQLYHYSRKIWSKDDIIRSWLSDYVSLLLLLSIFTGSSFAAVTLFNSCLFKFDIFDMGLNTQQLKEFNRKRIYSIVLLENAPQLILQTAFIALSQGDNDVIAITSIVFSCLSIIVSIVGMNVQKSINFTQGYTTITMDITGNCGKECQSLCKEMKNEFGKLLGVHAKTIEIIKPTPISQGFHLKMHVYVNDKSAQKLKIQRILNDANEHGKLAMIFEKAWNLSTPKISQIVSVRVESKEQRLNSEMPNDVEMLEAHVANSSKKNKKTQD